MKRKEFNEKRNEVIELVTKILKKYNEDVVFFEKEIFSKFRELPNKKPIQETIIGILGFEKFMEGKNDDTYLYTNTIHDIKEAIFNWQADWFCPRLRKYSVYISNIKSLDQQS